MNIELAMMQDLGRVGLRDRVLFLRTLPLFDGLDDEGLLLMAEHGSTAVYEDGQVIVAEGEPVRAVYVITQGEVVASRHGELLIRRRTGEAYGGLQLLAREPSVLAVASGETHLLEFPGAAFEAALIENYSLLRNMLRVMGSAVLESRGSLPADPNVPREVNEGTYYSEPRSMVERLIELRASPFGNLNLEALVDMARHMIPVRFPAGHVLWSIGDVSTHSLHVDAGRVRCSVDGKHVDVGSGFTIGVLDVWGARGRVYEARAETPLIASRIDYEAFLALLVAHPEVGLQLLRGFAKELVSTRLGE